MQEVKQNPKFIETACVVGVYLDKTEKAHAADLLDELAQLVVTLGVEVVERKLIHVRQMKARLLMGSGKAQELKDFVRGQGIDAIIFDNELTPAQQRNWESFSKSCVVDRQEVIIDIFARRAQTREARLQIDLARLQYSLPRLKRAWTHLGKQAGGIGARGEGETQLELDRRMVRDKIARLKAEIKQVRKNRATQRKSRQRVPMPHAAIVGYTNAGKSSLLRRLTGADVLIEDKLFATLDTTTRKLELPNRQTLLITDTVGFIRRLPHQLVDAFKATLEEAVEADFLIHVLDAGQENPLEIHQTTTEVLNELGAGEKETLTLLNKIETVTDLIQRQVLKKEFPDALPISVHTGEGIEDLHFALSDILSRKTGTMELSIPQSRADIIARLHREANVLNVDYEGDNALILAVVPERMRATYTEFLTKPTPPATEDIVGKST
jgi:GTP-binding protein HflX